jgi:hypothetical protein
VSALSLSKVDWWRACSLSISATKAGMTLKAVITLVIMLSLSLALLHRGARILTSSMLLGRVRGTLKLPALSLPDATRWRK